MRTLKEIAKDILFNDRAETVAAEFGWDYDLAVEYAAEHYNAAWDEAVAAGHTSREILRAVSHLRNGWED